jgi:Fe-S oxidoreductase
VGFVVVYMAGKKISKADRIEADNLMEEASEIFDSCIQCGMCKAICPVFRVLREESVSPRGKGILLLDKVMDNILFECTLCKGCEKNCPLNVKVCDAVRKGREAMVLRGRGLKENEEMIGNIRKTGNPFGKGDVKDLEKLYCC